MNEKPGMNEKKKTHAILDQINFILPRVNENADTFSPVCLLVSSLQLFGKSAAFSPALQHGDTQLSGRTQFDGRSNDAALISKEKFNLIHLI
jgi:hypothetical protein